MAVVTGVESAVRVHINRGDDLDARDEKGLTPLMISAARNKAAICRLLLAAGADANLLDPSGRSARDIAQAAGALEAAKAIEAADTPHAPSLHGNGYCVTAPGAQGGEGIPASNDPPASRQADAKREECDRRSVPLPRLDGVAAPGSVHDTESDPGDEIGDDGGDFDLTGWEVDEDQPAPAGDPTLSVAALALQSAITAHQPIDTSADWDDFEAFLPERATPLPRADDAETRERLRLVLLRAIREGSVPVASIQDLTRGDGGAPDAEASALLAMVINDLGAETDERFEYWSPHESFEVYVSPDETPDEADSIDDAMAFVDDLASRRNDPLRIYQREIQHEPLLTAQAEVALGQAMESGVEKALDALALWPSGIAAVLAAAREVSLGAKPLRWISSGPSAEPQEIDPDASAGTGIEIDPESELPAETDGDDDDDEAESPSGLDSKGSTDELTAFSAKAEVLSQLWTGTGQGNARGNACRNALASLGLTRGFLAELADLELGANPEAALAFRQAMKAYRIARDRMTVANLKLVHSIAKKYLFSGQPMDDLLQEGNIGLLKAVDRFDWRRGFKFSTYATWWIRQQVGRFVADKNKTIRLPVHIYEKTQRIAQAARAYELTHGRAPTVEEIAGLVALPIEKVVALSLASMEPLPIQEVDALDDHIAADARDQYTAPDPSDIVEVTHLIGAVDRILQILKHKEALVMRMRFGIGIHEPMTLEEIGVRLDVTRERIRQIEAKALRKLKHPVRLKQIFREFNGAPMNTRESVEGEAPPEEYDAKEDDDKPATFIRRPTPLGPPTKVTPTPTLGQTIDSSPATLAKLLNHVRAIGIIVEDYKEGSDRRIWVHLTEAPDNHSRKIVRKLIELGFILWPGKGYWR